MHSVDAIPAQPLVNEAGRPRCTSSSQRNHGVLNRRLPTRPSITSVAVRRLVTIFAARALIYALTVLGLGFPTSAGLRGGNSILVPLRSPGRTSTAVIPALALPVATYNVTQSVGVARRVDA